MSSPASSGHPCRGNLRCGFFLADGYWAAKRIAAISSAQIALAIEAGQISDPRARRAMQMALEGRRARVARILAQRVVPLEPVALTGNRLMLRDEAVALGVASSNVPTIGSIS